MAAVSESLQVIHNVLQVCGIHKCVACTRLIENKEFNSLGDFGFMAGDMVVLDMEKLFSSGAVATTVNLCT